MNLLIVTYDYVPKPVWGMGQHVFALRNAMVKAGHNVKIVTVNRYGLIKDDEKDVIFNSCYGRIEKNIQAQHCVDIPSDRSCLDELHQVVYERLKQESYVPDVIHCHGWMMFETSMKLSEIYRVPVVSTIHFMEKQYESVGVHPHPQELQIILEKEHAMVAKSDYLICVSDYGYKLLNEVYKGEFKRCEVISHGIDIGDMDVYPQKRLRTDNMKRLIFVGRLEEEKGIRDLCAVLDQNDVLNRVELEIVGTGSLEAELRKQYSGKYNFVGYIEHQNVYKHMAAADFIIIPSLDEQFGLVALEGMMVGAIPIASNTGGLKQIIVDKENGFLFDLGVTEDNLPCIDRRVLFESIMSSIDKPESIINRMREANFKKVTEFYSVDIMANRTVDVYKQAINNKNY